MESEIASTVTQHHAGERLQRCLRQPGPEVQEVASDIRSCRSRAPRVGQRQLSGQGISQHALPPATAGHLQGSISSIACHLASTQVILLQVKGFI